MTLGMDIHETSKFMHGPLIENTDEEKDRAVKVICGARACQGPDDAKYVLEMLGLIDSKENENAAEAS